MNESKLAEAYPDERDGGLGKASGRDGRGIDFKVKKITFNDTTVKLQIWDTAGQEQFHTISTSYFRGARGFVLVYDITNSDSFQGITGWMKDIHEKADDEVDIVLLGNKCDKETERVIPKHRGEKLAWEYGIPFFETSATNNINIEDAFSVLVKEILDKNSCILCDLDVVDLNESKKKRTCCQL
ncbi:ras-related protein Rab-10-like [Trachemys scripta elegans]|uniref:ras-related protein Rab-10-like n=1 Tax=Trachemys scripta elegans TaxID=31138 RepID=UPI001553888D|nr:ras-related protein Rab-10-like [Trachemys scripta elegans]